MARKISRLLATAGSPIQHVNTGSVPVRMITAFPNFDSALGSEMGVALEVLSPAPEFAAAAGSAS